MDVDKSWWAKQGAISNISLAGGRQTEFGRPGADDDETAPNPRQAVRLRAAEFAAGGGGTIFAQSKAVEAATAVKLTNDLMVSFVVAGGLGCVTFGVFFLLLFFQSKSNEGEELDISNQASDALLTSKAALNKEAHGQLRDYKIALESEHQEDLQITTLQFIDPDTEEEYLRFHAGQFCQSYGWACLAAGLVSVFQLREPALMLLNGETKPTTTPPVIVYCAFWVCIGLSAALIFALSRQPAFKRSRHQETLLLCYGIAGGVLVNIFGNKWRISEAFEVTATKAFGTYSQDDRLILTVILLVVYFATRTPIRHSRLILLTAMVGFAYPASSLAFGCPPMAEDFNHGGTSPTNRWRMPNPENCAWFIMVLIFVVLGHRCVEKQRRVSFLAVLKNFQAQRNEKIQLY